VNEAYAFVKGEKGWLGGKLCEDEMSLAGQTGHRRMISWPSYGQSIRRVEHKKKKSSSPSRAGILGDRKIPEKVSREGSRGKPSLGPGGSMLNDARIPGGEKRG